MFNADDLPIRGFIARVGLHHDDSGGVIVGLVDRMVQGQAPGYAADRDRLHALLAAAGEGEEAASAAPDLDAEVEAELLAMQTRQPELVARISAAVAEQDYGDVGGAPEEGEEFYSLDDARRAIKWAKLFARSRVDLPADYLRSVGDTVEFCVPMLVDLDTGLVDRAVTTLRQQVELFELVSRAAMLDALPGVHGVRIHPFVGFDPLRELNARKVQQIDTPLAIAQDAIDRFGFIGVKVYPQMGWRPSGNTPRPGLSAADAAGLDAIVDELAQWCAEQDVPITAHCNDSNYASPSYDDFGSPEQWFPVLDRHPSLHLNLGHFGGAHLSASDYGWGRTIATGMARYDHLYGDVGCYRADQADVLAEFIDVLKGFAADPATAVVGQRLMFGTDWYMNAINPDAEKFTATFTDTYTQAFGPDLAQRFLSANALGFLGLQPANQNGDRLRARYDKFGAARPDWLRP